jgi:hypothetical protein
LKQLYTRQDLNQKHSEPLDNVPAGAVTRAGQEKHKQPLAVYACRKVQFTKVPKKIPARGRALSLVHPAGFEPTLNLRFFG